MADPELIRRNWGLVVEWMNIVLGRSGMRRSLMESYTPEQWDEAARFFGFHAMPERATLMPRQIEAIERAVRLIARAERADELQRTFDIRWAADQRAIKRWQEAHPDSERVWPDHADMVVWLMEQHEGLG
jgi:hypothetical protein